MAKESPLRCCESCGRDCRGRYCRQCIGHESQQRNEKPATDDLAEDDYSEESNPDGIYREGHGLTEHLR